jgi:hypothetical protein
MFGRVRSGWVLTKKGPFTASDLDAAATTTR